MKKGDPEVKRFVVILDREYVEAVIPKLKKVLHKKDMGELLKSAFGILALHVEIIEKGNRLVEVDDEGNPIRYFGFPEVEIEAFQRNIKFANFIKKFTEE